MGVPTPCSKVCPTQREKRGRDVVNLRVYILKLDNAFDCSCIVQKAVSERGNMSYKSQYRTLFQRTINQLTNFQKNIKILRDIKIAEVVKFEACKYGTDMPISKKKIKEIKEWRVLYYFLTIQKKKRKILTLQIFNLVMFLFLMKIVFKIIQFTLNLPSV